jgi:hypothetical protein
MAEIYKQDSNLSPGTWKGAKTPQGRTALFCCPNGHIGSLSNHGIDSMGYVSPSVVCPEHGCSFHEYIVLDGWDS